LAKGPSRENSNYFAVLPKKSLFSHLRASASKTKSGFGLILIGHIRSRLKISAAENFFLLESLIFYKITKTSKKA